jgi:indolepyruvate ferredoxin oxidoreductase alpha subunit
MQPTLLEYAEQSDYNQLELFGPKGVIAAGLAHNYVCEALGTSHRHSILKIGVYPPPVSLIRRLMTHCEEILVAEEGYPLIEDRLRGFLGVPGKSIRGKRDGAIPLAGELSVDSLRTALGLAPLEARTPLPDVPGRPPQLCSGCPHCDTFKAMNDATAGGVRPYLFSDIGCYTLGALPPYNAIETCVDMGASISMALGAAKAGAHPVLCTIGDSTFIHSGMTSLIGAATEDANMTVIILDNGTVAMTGAQEVFVTGKELMRVIRGLGVNEEHLHQFVPKPNRHDQFTDLIRREINHRGLSVIVSHRPCIHLKRREVRRAETEEAAVS